MDHKIFYRGYSTATYTKTGQTTLTNIDIVKMDLLTHIFTRRGSRVMMPNHGTIIPELTFEMIDEQLIETIYSEIKTVIDYDPRVQLLSLTVNPYPDINTVIAAAVLRYIEFDVVDVLNIELNESSVGQ